METKAVYTTNQLQKKKDRQVKTKQKKTLQIKKD